jgi:hypothetical protein
MFPEEISTIDALLDDEGEALVSSEYVHAKLASGEWRELTDEETDRAVRQMFARAGRSASSMSRSPARARAPRSRRSARARRSESCEAESGDPDPDPFDERLRPFVNALADWLIADLERRPPR